MSDEEVKHKEWWDSGGLKNQCPVQGSSGLLLFQNIVSSVDRASGFSGEIRNLDFLI